MTIHAKLCAEFPRNQVSWRAQTVSNDGKKALALAYIDARDVMKRLDDVIGPDYWQVEYSFVDPIIICRLGIYSDILKCWVWKSNGAGQTDIEGEKGGASDAFKRAAVLWGIGQYLYDLSSPWVPCESYESNGKKKWKNWTADPWDYVAKNRSPFKNAAHRNEFCITLTEQMRESGSIAELKAVFEGNQNKLNEMKNGVEYDVQAVDALRTEYERNLARIRELDEAALRGARELEEGMDRHG